MFGASKPRPPPPPPPPPNPPTYASVSAAPSMGMGRFGGLSNSVLTSPLGPQDQRTAQRKSLLGQ